MAEAALGAGTAAAESAPVETAAVPAEAAAAAPVAQAVGTTSAPAPGKPVPAAAAPAAPAPAAADQEDSLNLLSLVGPVIARRAAPVVGAVAGGVLITWIIRRIWRRKAS